MEKETTIICGNLNYGNLCQFYSHNFPGLTSWFQFFAAVKQCRDQRGVEHHFGVASPSCIKHYQVSTIYLAILNFQGTKLFLQGGAMG